MGLHWVFIVVHRLFLVVPEPSSFGVWASLVAERRLWIVWAQGFRHVSLAMACGTGVAARHVGSY